MADHADSNESGIGSPSWTAPSAPPAERARADGPLEVSGYGDPQIGLRASGAVNLLSHAAWERALRQATGRGGEIHLELTDLEFIDVRGVTMLVDVGSRLTNGYRIVVHHAPPCLRRIMQALWPDGAAAITIIGER